MSFWRSRLGVLLLVIATLVAGLGSWIGYGVHRLTASRQQPESLPDFESMRIRVSEVEFNSADGTALSGWWMPVASERPAILLCHDRGASKRSMINLAIALRENDFPVLMFDFRGHGDSAESRSGLGLLEKQDVLGALDWIAQRRGGRVGVFGAGMGAHAAVLAAAERRELEVLVLDGLYPDAAYPLARDVRPGWVRGGVGALANGAYFLFHGTSPRSQRAADIVGGLSGRHLLMLAPASDSALMEEMREMVRTIPETIDADGNLVVVPATLGEGLYGEQLGRYHQRVTEFFTARLLSSEVELAAGW